MIIYIGGISGVGKTTIIENVEKIAKREKLDIRRAKVKEALRDLAGVKSVKEYRKLPEDLRYSLHQKAIKIIYEEDLKNSRIVYLYDGRFSLLNRKCGNEEMRLIQKDDFDHLIAVIVLTASPDTILARRIIDSKIRKDRHIDDVCFMKKRQCNEIKAAQIYSKVLGIPLNIVQNEGEILMVAKKVADIIKNIMKWH